MLFIVDIGQIFVNALFLLAKVRHSADLLQSVYDKAVIKEHLNKRAIGIDVY